MLIAIASGKGGTGKTTIAVNLALSLKDTHDVVLLDCDVEEPNVHLFMQPTFTDQAEVMTTVPEIAMDKCDGCGKCSEFCAFHAIGVAGHRPITFPELCHSCGGCTLVCPSGAITEVPRRIGSIEIGCGSGISNVKGALEIGSPLAPMVVDAVRNAIPQDHSNKAIIIDASPGTSCAVVAATQNADFCLLVTEPTPFGLNDLTVAVELARRLELPHGVVINRAGLGDSSIHDYCNRTGIPILMEIPFELKYAACYARGGRLVEEFPDLKDKFLRLWDLIQQQTKTRAGAPK
ncbi:MAG: P-loop NTPase [Firmicutes bacterium]|nr:P-loop NTPase [Bacillota bacterium]